MTVFANAIDAIFADSNFCVDALWRGADVGDGVAVRVARYRPGDTSEFNGGSFITNGERLELRQSDVSAVSEGDTFEIDAQRWRVKGAPERQDDALTWIVTIVAVS